jgi:hypothetical protein
VKVDADRSIALAFQLNFGELIHQLELSPEQMLLVRWDCSGRTCQLLQEHLGHSQTPNNTENITIMCRANASGTYKLQLLCEGMIKEPEYGEGTEINCFHVDYYNHELVSVSGRYCISGLLSGLC